MLTLALILDALLGEPAWLWQRAPHPAVLMGRAVSTFERRLNSGAGRKVKGALTMMVLILAAGLSGLLLGMFGPVVEVIVAAILIAQRSLTQHVSAVATGLRMGLPNGRRAVAMIVSRDTGNMSEANIARSAIESGAENLSDGVIAPAFWFLVAGLPGLLIYKIVNTADSMIGYRTARYEQFGWAAARIDDLLNWIPARITAVLIALPSGILSQWRDIRADAALHKSPNAGWPEAAMGRAIGVALAGPRAYNGEMQHFAWVNGAGTHDIGPAHIDAAVTRLWQAWGVMLALTLLIGLLF